MVSLHALGHLKRSRVRTSEEELSLLQRPQKMLSQQESQRSAEAEILKDCVMVLTTQNESTFYPPH